MKCGRAAATSEERGQGGKGIRARAEKERFTATVYRSTPMERRTETQIIEAALWRVWTDLVHVSGVHRRMLVCLGEFCGR